MAKNLWLLIFGRLTLSVFLLFLSGLAWSRGTTGTAEHASLPIFFAVVALSLLYVAALKVSENLFLQSLSQLSVDLLLITWLVWVTGDVNSPFSVLYVVFIAVVSLILGPGGAIASCLISSLVFTALSISTVSGWLQSYA